MLLAVFFFAGDDFERELDEDFFEPPVLFDFEPVEREPVDFFLVGISYFPPDVLLNIQTIKFSKHRALKICVSCWDMREDPIFALEIYPTRHPDAG